MLAVFVDDLGSLHASHAEKNQQLNNDFALSSLSTKVFVSTAMPSVAGILPSTLRGRR